MNKQDHSKKPQDSISLYSNFPLQCHICLQDRKISKRFKKPYALLYHLTNIHNLDDEIRSGISIHETKLAIGGILTALQYHMFLENSYD